MEIRRKKSYKHKKSSWVSKFEKKYGNANINSIWNNAGKLPIVRGKGDLFWGSRKEIVDHNGENAKDANDVMQWISKDLCLRSIIFFFV